MGDGSRIEAGFLTAMHRVQAMWRAALGRWHGCAVVALSLLAAGVPTPVAAAIPAGERAVLVNLYNSTGGPSWTDNSGWSNPATGVTGASGAECTWWGVGCDAGGNHVTLIFLANNNLVGTLPALGDLASLQAFYVDHNLLTGNVPSLAGLSSLAGFSVAHNQFGGGIPSLAGLTALRYFYANGNNLTGSVPSLAGLAALEEFNVGANQLTGTLPVLSGSPGLKEFYARSNHFTGALPSLSGLTALLDFDVSDNQLTGPIPPLAGLTSLTYFNVGANQLDGSVPSLAGLASLQSFYIFLNRLTGPMALPPNPSALLPGESNLCANQLQSTGNAAADQAWDVASGTVSALGQPGWIACQGFAFGDQVVFTTSAPKALTITATADTGVITFTSIVATGDFAEGNNCPPNLQVGASCTINVTFTPTALGPRTGDLTFVGGTVGTGPITASLPLRGNGVAAPIVPTTPPAIPTQSEVGLLLLMLTLAVLGMARAGSRRRRRR